MQGRTGLILCKFTGDNQLIEPSADDGDPRREFFTLLHTAIVKNSGIFSTGKPFLILLITIFQIAYPNAFLALKERI